MFNKIIALLGLSLLPVVSSAQVDAIDLNQVNSLSQTYQASARYEYSENDVKRFVYEWFAAFDHQREPGYFLNRIALPVQMQYPDFPIKSQADFLRWYQGVTDNIVWNAHDIATISVSGNQASTWQVSYDVNWKAKSKDNQHYDVMVHQELTIIRIGDSLKIAKLKAKIVDSKK